MEERGTVAPKLIDGGKERFGGGEIGGGGGGCVMEMFRDESESGK